MTLIQFLRLVGNNLKILFGSAFTLSLVVFLLTKGQKKEYTSYTLINTGLVSGYNIESQQSSKIDYAFTNNELENLMGLVRSRETMEELGARLLSECLMMTKSDPEKLIESTFLQLKKDIPEKVRKQVVGKTAEETYQKIIAQRDNDVDNLIKKILLSNYPYFGIEQLEGIQVRRENASDMIRITYTCNDPGLCKRTITLLTELFIAKHRSIKENQTTNVLDFFEQATHQSESDLKEKEDNLLEFMVQNKIINYYEQTRFIAAKKEDLDEFYYKELMNLTSADSSLFQIEQQLGNKVNLPQINRKLINQKRQLADISAQIALLELKSLDSLTNNDASLDKLRKQSDEVKKSIKTSAESTFAINRTPEGVETQNLLSQWLSQTLNLEQARARLVVLKERKKEFDAIYSRFAPWGSRLKRIEREIDVAEKAYLENLHSFNQARLHKYNMMMSTNLQVVDSPFLPTTPKASKRMMLVIVGFLGGFILSLTILLVLEYMDNSLKEPVRASDMTGLELFGVFPAFPGPKAKPGNIKYDIIKVRTVDQLLLRIKLDIRERDIMNRPKFINIISTRKGDGKTFTGHLASEQLRKSGERVIFMRPAEFPGEQPMHPDDIFYTIDDSFFSVQHVEMLVGDRDVDFFLYDYVFIEIPGLLVSQYPADLIAIADLSLLVCRANRTWNTADKTALLNFHRAVNHSCGMVLNGVRVDALENSLGEIPKSRSRLRKWLKKMASFNLAKA